MGSKSPVTGWNSISGFERWTLIMEAAEGCGIDLGGGVQTSIRISGFNVRDYSYEAAMAALARFGPELAKEIDRRLGLIPD